MKAVKWPLVGNNVTATGVIVAESLSKFQTVIEYLLQIQIEDDEGDDGKDLCLPVKCLVKPLRKR